jgi:putative endopeptidase
MYRHFNGTWLKNAVIASDRASDGAFTALLVEAEARVREIIETASGSDEAKKLGDIYASFMDADSVQTKGATPIAQDLTAVDSIENLESFIQVLAKL